MYSLAFSFWESSNGITWLPLYCRDPSTPGSTLARVIVYFFEKLTRVLTGSVKEQGQILISLHRSSRVVFFFFSFKDLRKGRYICLIIQVSWHLWSAGKPSVCIDQKGKKSSNMIKLCCVWQPLLHRELFYRSWRKIDFQVCPLLSFYATGTSVFVVTSFSDSHCPV